MMTTWSLTPGKDTALLWPCSMILAPTTPRPPNRWFWSSEILKPNQPEIWASPRSCLEPDFAARKYKKTHWGEPKSALQSSVPVDSLNIKSRILLLEMTIKYKYIFIHNDQSILIDINWSYRKLRLSFYYWNIFFKHPKWAYNMRKTYLSFSKLSELRTWSILKTDRWNIGHSTCKPKWACFSEMEREGWTRSDCSFGSL